VAVGKRGVTVGDGAGPGSDVRDGAAVGGAGVSVRMFASVGGDVVASDATGEAV